MRDKLMEIKEMCKNTNCGACSLYDFCDEYFEEIPEDWGIDSVKEPIKQVRTIEIIEGLKMASKICGETDECEKCPIRQICDMAFKSAPTLLTAKGIEEYARE